MSESTRILAEDQDQRPVLSIVLPALEVDDELGYCVASIRKTCRDHSAVEVVLVVPMTLVSTAKLRFANERVVAESRASLYGAMNDGTRAARGRYLYYIGKDDVVLPPFSQVVAHLSKNDLLALFFNVYWGADGLRTCSTSRWKCLLSNICHQGIVYSRQAIEKHGPYVRRFKVQADTLVNLKMLWDRTAGPPIRYLAIAPVWFSGTGVSSTRRDILYLRMKPLAFRRYVGEWAYWTLLIYRRLRNHVY
jgi:glycosyltransferase involved in cell wall biosynthesis